jgi:hypothetical protein
MQKTCSVLFLLAYITATLATTVFEAPDSFEFAAQDTYDSTELFFLGFADPFGLEDAAKSLIECVATVPSNLLSDLGHMMSDVQHNDWTGVLSYGLEVIADIDALQTDCPDGADPFVNEFQPLVNAYNNNSQAVVNEITNNCQKDAFSIALDIASMAVDFNDNQIQDAGEEFGTIVNVALKGIIPN